MKRLLILLLSLAASYSHAVEIEDGVTTKGIYIVATDPNGRAATGLDPNGFSAYWSRNGSAPGAAFSSVVVAEVDATNMAGVYWFTVNEGTTLPAGSDTEEMVCTFSHSDTSATVLPRSLTIIRPKGTIGETATISSGEVAATAGSIQAGMAAQGYTIVRANNIDFLDLALTTMNANIGAVANDVWTYDVSGQTDPNRAGGLLKTNLDAQVSLSGGGTLTADVLPGHRTWKTGREGNTSEQIVKLNTWSTGTRAVSVDFTKALSPGATINAFSSATATRNSDSSTVTTSGLATRQDKRAVNFEIAAISTAGTYTIEATVTTTDSMTFSLKGTLIVE